jgi:hypothetical protein
MEFRNVQSLCGLISFYRLVPSVQQKSRGLKFSKSRTGSHVTHSYHHNSSRFTFPIFVHLWCFCLPVITVNHAVYILTKDTNTFAKFEVNT